MCKSHLFFFFNDTATTEIYTLSLHDALPIFFAVFREPEVGRWVGGPHKTIEDSRALIATNLAHEREQGFGMWAVELGGEDRKSTRLNLQSRQYLVCRLLLEKKKLTRRRRRQP